MKSRLAACGSRRRRRGRSYFSARRSRRHPSRRPARLTIRVPIIVGLSTAPTDITVSSKPDLSHRGYFLPYDLKVSDADLIRYVETHEGHLRGNRSGYITARSVGLLRPERGPDVARPSRVSRSRAGYSLTELTQMLMLTPGLLRVRSWRRTDLSVAVCGCRSFRDQRHSFDPKSSWSSNVFSTRASARKQWRWATSHYSAFLHPSPRR